MADYKRIVSYIYQYNQQVKGNNVGFTRLETRNDQCKIIVHVRVPNLENTIVKIYTYCWYDGIIHGIHLGDMSISGGVGEFKILTEADNLCHTQYRLSDMGGILVYISDAMFMGTEWDDRPIRFDTLMIDTEKPVDFQQRRNLKGEEISEAVVEAASVKEEAEEVVAVLSEEDDQVVVEEVVQEEESIDIEAAAILAEPLEEQRGQEDLAEDVPFDTSQSMSAENVEASLPLSKKRMERLDQQAQELFGSMLKSNMFQPQAKESVEEEESPLVVDPLAALEYFTSFKSCESEQEYLEVLQEIDNLHSRIGQLERICREWRIKEARKKEIQLAKLEAEKEKRQIEEELRQSFHIENAKNLYDDNEEQSLVKLRAAENEVEQEEDGDLENIKELEVKPLEDSIEDSMEDSMEEEEGLHPVVQRILSRYPMIEPFSDIEPGLCVRIEPQDIGIFPMENWILANNSFLLHGYYSYRHLIFFCKVAYGRPVYLLGIPGVNHSRERFMANMFGFSMFQPLTKVGDNVQAANNSMKGNPAYDEEQGGEFGYWCMEIMF